MRLRWHLWSILSASLVAGIIGLCTNGPVWQFNRFEVILFAGYCDATRELRSVVVRDQGKSWHLETRDVRDGRLIREVPLDKPADDGSVYYIANAISDQPDLAPLILVQAIRRNTSRVERCYLFDPVTGVRLRKDLFILKGYIMPVVSSNRAAILTERDLWLFDDRHVQGRWLNIVGIDCIQLSHDGKLVAYIGQDGVHIIEWETGDNHLALENVNTNPFYLMSFLRDGTLLLANYRSGFQTKKWQWNGKTLQPVTPLFVALDHVGGGPIGSLRLKEEGSHYHVPSYAYVGWPEEIRTVCRWLKSFGWNVQKWLPHETRLVWHVLDENNHEIRRYEEPAFRPITLSDRLAVNYFDANKKTTVIELWLTAPRWPNLLACGMLVYLILYVWGRCRLHIHSGP